MMLKDKYLLNKNISFILNFLIILFLKQRTNKTRYAQTIIFILKELFCKIIGVKTGYEKVVKMKN